MRTSLLSFVRDPARVSLIGNLLSDVPPFALFINGVPLTINGAYLVIGANP